MIDSELVIRNSKEYDVLVAMLDISLDAFKEDEPDSENSPIGKLIDIISDAIEIYDIAHYPIIDEKINEQL